MSAPTEQSLPKLQLTPPSRLVDGVTFVTYRQLVDGDGKPAKIPPGYWSLPHGALIHSDADIECPLDRLSIDGRSIIGPASVIEYGISSSNHSVNISGIVGSGTVMKKDSSICQNSVLGKRVVLEQGVTVAHKSEIGDETRLGLGAEVLESQVGARVSIGAKSRVKQSEIGDEAVIGKHCQVESATLHRGVKIGDGCKICPGAVVLPDVRVPKGLTIPEDHVYSGGNHAVDPETGARVQVRPVLPVRAFSAVRDTLTSLMHSSHRDDPGKKSSTRHHLVWFD